MRYHNENAQPFLRPLAWLERGRQLWASNPKASVVIPLAAFGPPVLLLALAFAGPTVVLPTADRAFGRYGELVVAAVVEGYLGAVSLVFMLVMPALLGGALACFLGGVRSGKLEATRLRDGFRSWWACTWTVWLLLCGTVLSLPLVAILVGVPSIYALHTLMWLALLRIVDRGCGGMESLGFAWRVMQRQSVMLTVFTFVTMTLVAAGTLVVVGLVTVVPIAAGTLAAAYEDLSERETRGKATVSTGGAEDVELQRS